MKEYRSVFNYIIEKAEVIANELEINPIYKNNALRRRKKRTFVYECRDDAPEVPEITFKRIFFIPILYVINISLTDRFELFSNHATKFNLLTNFSNVKNSDINDLLKHCKNLENTLNDDKDRNINGLELFTELQI